MLVSAGSAVSTGTELADSTPTRFQQYFGGVGLHLTGVFAAYGQLYKSQPWVYTLVRKLGTAGARMPIKVYERVSDTDRQLVRDHPYAELLRRPNPKIGAKFLYLWTYSTIELYGEAMWWKLRDENDRVRELHPIHPTNMLVERDKDGELRYAYLAYGQGRASLVPFKSRDVVHFKGYNPDNVIRGLSPCEPLRQTLLAEDASRRAQSAMWRNGARPSVVLSTDKQLTPKAIDSLRQQWDDIHAGVDSWAKTAVLEEGMTPHTMQMSYVDMQYIDGRRLNREECCAVWDVPPPAVQILDRATFSNITEQLISLYRETMTPRVDSFEDVLATSLAPDFDLSGAIYAECVMDAVLRGSFEQRAEAKAKLITTGQMTPAEARADDNLPFIEGSDQLLVNAALVPLNAVPKAAEDKQEPEPVPVPSQRTKSVLTREEHDWLAGRLGRVKALDDIDAERLVRDLSEEAQSEVRGLLIAARFRNVDVATLRAWVAASVIEEIA